MGLRQELKRVIVDELNASGVQYPQHTGQNTVVERLLDEIEAVLLRNRISRPAQPKEGLGQVISADPAGLDRTRRMLPRDAAYGPDDPAL